MIKKFLLPLFLLFSLFSIAQQGTSSPYSFYGIGDVKFKGTAETRAMGGVSIFSDSIHLNLQNPASYSSLRYTTFTVAGTFTASKLTTRDEKENAQRTTVDYLALGVPLGKFGAAFGLVPYSSVGYRIHNDDLTTKRKYTGEGGLNRAFLGLGYQFTPRFSIGADINYNFGKIETNSVKSITDIQFGTAENNVSEMSGLGFNIGAMYNRKINNKFDFFSGITFSPQTNMSTTNVRNIYTAVVSGDFDPSPVDYSDPQTTKSNIKLPSKITMGAGIGQNKKWMFGTEVTLQESSKFGNRFNEGSNARFENSVKYSFGGYYIPNYSSFSNYFARMTYRGGFRYENTGLIVNNERIRDYAASGGLGFPLGGALSNLNITFELGRRGTAKALLIEENYMNFVISLSLNDRWFVKSRYN